jgi:hypothetical protein
MHIARRDVVEFTMNFNALGQPLQYESVQGNQVLRYSYIKSINVFNRKSHPRYVSKFIPGTIN